jgi:large subunit ribosomal protein L24
MKRKIKREDEVVVISGRSKGKTGKIVKVLDDGRVIVSGVHLVKKHVKPNPQAGIAGGIVEKEAPLDISNVALINPQTGKGDRVGYQVDENGKKVRIFKSNKMPVDK